LERQFDCWGLGGLLERPPGVSEQQRGVARGLLP